MSILEDLRKSVIDGDLNAAQDQVHKALNGANDAGGAGFEVIDLGVDVSPEIYSGAF
jgi:methanogenic corrinoid protein MtbC1